MMDNDLVFFWAKVETTNPLTVKRDGETEPIGAEPDVLVDKMALTTSSRVRCQLHHKRVIVLGVAGGAPKIRFGYTYVDPTDHSEKDDWMRGHTSIKFPEFENEPKIILTPQTAYPHLVAVGVSSIDKDGCDLYVARKNSTETGVHWMAIEYV